MPTKTYHKLVRDNIPENIGSDGKTTSAKLALTKTTFDFWIKS